MGQPHSEMFFVRVTKREKLLIQDAAEKAGFSSTSEWFRVILKKMLHELDSV